MESARPPRILSIQSEVVHGHVGHAAARFALQRLGVDVLALPTIILSNHPGYGRFKGRATPAEDLKALLDGLEEGGFLVGLDGVMSGYLGSADQAEVVRDAVLRVKRANPKARYLLDPVFGDDGGAYARPGVAEAMAKHLLPLADIVTPNRFELASLTSRKVTSQYEAVEAAEMLGRPFVFVTSVPMEGNIGVVMVGPHDDVYPMIEAPRVESLVSGTGDLFAALLMGHLMLGAPYPKAMNRAVEAVDAMIRAAAETGAREMPLVAHQDWLVNPPAHGDVVRS